LDFLLYCTIGELSDFHYRPGGFRDFVKGVNEMLPPLHIFVPNEDDMIVAVSTLKATLHTHPTPMHMRDLIAHAAQRGAAFVKGI
jgi:hypothetical protein